MTRDENTITRTGEGIPVGTSREEERLDELQAEKKAEKKTKARDETSQ